LSYIRVPLGNEHNNNLYRRDVQNLKRPFDQVGCSSCSTQPLHKLLSGLSFSSIHFRGPIA